MTSGYLRAIIAFALTRQTLRSKAFYLIRGLAFAPWLGNTVGGKSSRSGGAAADGESGDDIYPLF